MLCFLSLLRPLISMKGMPRADSFTKVSETCCMQKHYGRVSRGFIFHVSRSRKLGWGWGQRKRLECDSNLVPFHQRKTYIVIEDASCYTAFVNEAAGIVGPLVHISSLCSISSRASNRGVILSMVMSYTKDLRFRSVARCWRNGPKMLSIPFYGQPFL